MSHDTQSVESGLEISLVYRPAGPLGRRGIAYLFGGAAGVLLAVVVFIINVSLPPERQPRFAFKIGASVIPTMLGLAAIAKGLSLLQTPSSVELTDEGLRIEGTLGTRTLSWAEVARVETSKRTPFLTYEEIRTLDFFDSKGRRILSLTEVIDQFDDLVEQAQKLAGTASGAQASDGLARKKKREGVLMVALAPMIFALGAVNAWMAWDEWTNIEAFETSGIDTEAVITQHYKHYVTPRIEYRFQDADGREFLRDTSVVTEMWEHLSEGDPVSIRFVPSNPDYSRLLVGETEEFEDPRLMLVLGIGMSLFALFCIGYGLFAIRGYDIEVKNGRLQIIRYGEEVVREDRTIEAE